MSRYNLPGKIPNTTIAVGFDRPMECYFFQLWSPIEISEEPIINTDSRSNYDICELLKEHADMSNEQAKFVYEAIASDYDPDEYKAMQLKQAENVANVRQMFGLVGKKLPN